MNLHAQAVLNRVQGTNKRVSVVRLVALDQPGSDATARHVVTLQITQVKAGLARRVDESTLTPMPVPLALARERAVAFIRQRLAAGDVQASSEGLELAPTMLATSRPVGALSGEAQATYPESPVQAKCITALCDKLDGNAWRLMSASQQARLIWRLAEYADPARGGAAQRVLQAQVRRLVALMVSGDNLLD
ncbi:hypothetical protein [Diaphorobacter sp.]|uniref:hypothetical protein n=1 Tax=Diaphorobacter sp. TaxID=1934310 RepID=UPI0028A5E783|nr:hypothetical protein [Diaphorobacter sp.]